MLILGYSGFTRDSRAGGIRSPLAKTHLDFDSMFAFRDGEVPFSLFPLGFLGHDAAAGIIRDGRVIACVAEERFTRVKHALNLAGNTLLPRHAVSHCLGAARATVKDLDAVAHYCDFNEDVISRRLALLRPFLDEASAERVGDSYHQLYDRMMAAPVIQRQFEKMTGFLPKRIIPVRHHEAHAASAFYPSGFRDALILTIDGTGELESSLLAVGHDHRITELHRTYLPTSLGSLYLMITVFLGFCTLGDEYKVMGLAAYGEPDRYTRVFEELITFSADGQYATPWLIHPDFKHFLVDKLGPPRLPDAPIQQRHADIAAALQARLQTAVLHTLRYAQEKTGLRHLCMAGGVALNCLLNGAIARAKLFDAIFVQPASSDEGGGIGAALYASYHSGGETPPATIWPHAYLGPAYHPGDMRASLQGAGRRLQWALSNDITTDVARELANGKVVGWFQGRMEFGPRALGNRSILADPRHPSMKDHLNAKIKHRETFRPFAPAIREEDAPAYFEMCGMPDSPYMLFALPVLHESRDRIPAAIHVDGTARVQTVSRKTNPLFWKLLERFHKLTGVPVLLNTSFNVRNEPIVCSPRDAINCFLSTDIDILALGDYLVTKRGTQ